MSPSREVAIVKRPTPNMQRSLPIGARSVGHGLFPFGDYEDYRVQDYAKVMWCVRGAGLVTYARRERRFVPGQIAVFVPRKLHRARSDDEMWEARWFTADGPLVREVMASFGLKSEGICESAPAPAADLDRLAAAIGDVTPGGEERASAIAYELLAMASRPPRASTRDELVSRAVEIIEAQWSSGELGVESIAQRLGIHRSSLSRRFKAALGISPQVYVTRLRMQRALSMLRQTDTPVSEVARRCGYADAGYFTRMFRKTQGTTPRRWRGG